MTTVAIINTNSEANVFENIVDKIIFANIFLFQTKQIQEKQTKLLDMPNIEYVVFPDEVDTLSKQHNFVINYMKNTKGINENYLHIIEDSIKINADPSKFINDLENMMNIFDLNSWFSTVTDMMNYVYKKYNPRLKIEFDDPEYSGVGLARLIFTSHANVYWTCFNLAANTNELLFNEQFKIRMFIITEFLAKRRANAINTTSINYMNMYPTVDSEIDTFEIATQEKINFSPDELKKEDEIFKSYKLDITPTNIIDLVLEDIYKILAVKLNKKENK